MRVALVTHYMPPHIGGVEEVAAHQARTYAAAGHEVTWIAAAPPHAPGLERGEGVTLLRLPAWNTLEDRLAMPYPVLGRGSSARIDEVVSRSDLVHIHDCLYQTSLAGERAARRHGRPLIVTQHVAIVRFLGGAMDPALTIAYRTVGAGVLRRARHVAFVSEAVRDWFARNVADGPRSWSVVPNAVDTDAFRPADQATRRAARAALGVPLEGPVILFAGRLVPKKHVAELVAALDAVAAHLLVVGDGPERRQLARLGSRVTHHAHVPHEEMPRVFAAADLFTLPSTGEGLPLAVLEALASGLRCVLSDDPSFAPLAECDGVTCGPVRALGSTLAAVLAQRAADRADREGAARSWAAERYGRAASARRYLAIAEAAPTAARR